MALPIEFEILVPLIISLFFSLLYEFNKDENFWAGIVAMVCWLTSGMVFLVVSTYPVISLIFNAVGIIYIVRLVLDAFKPLQGSRRLEGDTD